MNRTIRFESRNISLILAIGVIAAQCLLTSCQKKAPPGHYDMVAASVTYKPQVVRVGDQVVFSHSVRNDGRDTVPGGTYHVDLYVDGRVVSFDHGTF